MDTIVAFIARGLLVLTFGISGFAKISSRGKFADNLSSFGVPVVLTRPLAVLIPILELVVAGLVVMSPLVGGIGSLTLLVLFSAVIGLNLLRGRRPNCQCFGQLRSSPIGWQTLCRNGVLAAGAVVALLQGQSTNTTGLFDPDGRLYHSIPLLSPMETILAVLVVLQGWFGIHLIRQHGRILRRLDAIESGAALPVGRETHMRPEELPIGSQAPQFELPDQNGTITTLSSLLASGRSTMLVFSDPDCSPCKALLPQIAEWEDSVKRVLQVAVVTRLLAQGPKKLENGPKTILFQKQREVAELFKAMATPSAVVIAPTGAIASYLAIGAQAISELGQQFSQKPATVEQSVYQGMRAGAVEPGSFVPPFELRDLDGQIFHSVDLVGKSTLLLFWNPDCPHCANMIDEVRRWESDAKEGQRIVLISSGSRDQNVALQLSSRILLDSNFLVGALFSITGTPSAALITDDGTLKTAIVVGGPGIKAIVKEWSAHKHEHQRIAAGQA